IGGRFRAKEIIGEGDAVLHQLIGHQAIFLRGKDVCVQVEIVAFVVDELEGQHERSLWRNGLFQVFCEKQIPRSTRDDNKLPLAPQKRLQLALVYKLTWFTARI